MERQPEVAASAQAGARQCMCVWSKLTSSQHSSSSGYGSSIVSGTISLEVLGDLGRAFRKNCVSKGGVSARGLSSLREEILAPDPVKRALCGSPS